MTKILLIIVILFIISQSIKLVPDVYEVYRCYGHPEGPPACWQDPPAIILKTSWLAHLALNINSSTNFLVYVAWGTKFRKAFFKATRELLQQILSIFPNTRHSTERYSTAL